MNGNTVMEGKYDKNFLKSVKLVIPLIPLKVLTI